MPEYFTLVELRALPDMSNTTKYPDARVEAEAAHVVAVIEREVGAAFVSRTVTDEIHDGGTDAIVLDQPFAVAASAATENGVAVTDQLRVHGGVLRRFGAGSYSPGTWANGVGNVAVTYTHCYSATPPADLKNAALWATRARLLENSSTASISDRQTSMSTESGTIQFVVAGQDRPFGIPAIDEVVIGWKRKLDVFGFA